jgi:hypothetical protein
MVGQRGAGSSDMRLTEAMRRCSPHPQEDTAMAGNQPDTHRNPSPRPDRVPPGAPRGNDNTSGYDEKKPTSVTQRDAPDPTRPGNPRAQAGAAGPDHPPEPGKAQPQDPDAPDIDQPVPPGDVPSKTPVKERERGEAQYVAGANPKSTDPQAMFSDAARPVVPGPADGAD